MRYHLIRETDIANGEGIGVALFVQGCPFHCKNCFNPETWDFNNGKEWTDKVENKFLELIDKPYIKRVSVLGGEPLADENVEDVFKIIKKIHTAFPNKNIWLYTGYTVKNDIQAYIDNYYELQHGNYLYCEPVSTNAKKNIYRSGVLSLIDVLVDGRFEENKKDPNLQFRGSSNQRIISVKESLEKGEIVLWTP